jgi:hypothetical protein
MQKKVQIVLQALQDHLSITYQQAGKRSRQGVGPAKTPTVISPLLVVDAKAPKLHTCIDLSCVNLFLKYVPFKYEVLSDVKYWVLPDDLLATMDDKSG